MEPKKALEWLLANSYRDGYIVKIPADLFYKTVKDALTAELVRCDCCGNLAYPEDMRPGRNYKQVCPAAGRSADLPMVSLRGNW